MKNFRCNTAERNRYNCKEFHHRELLTTQQLISIQDAFVPVAGSDASGDATSQTAQFGHRLAFLLSYAGALRGESTRTIELSDLSTVFAENEGQKGCNLLVLYPL